MTSARPVTGGWIRGPPELDHRSSLRTEPPASQNDLKMWIDMAYPEGVPSCDDVTAISVLISLFPVAALARSCWHGRSLD